MGRKERHRVARLSDCRCSGHLGQQVRYGDGVWPCDPAPERSSYDHLGNSYAANLFMTSTSGGGEMRSNSPYLRPTTRVPTPARTLYYEENIGRWAWSSKRELTECGFVGPGVDPGPSTGIRGWHGRG